MNQISVIQEQAFTKCKTYEDGQVIKTDEVFKEFAKLIIEECATICDRHANQLRQYNFEDNATTAETCARSIKEHFGLKDGK